MSWPARISVRTGTTTRTTRTLCSAGSSTHPRVSGVRTPAPTLEGSTRISTATSHRRFGGPTDRRGGPDRAAPSSCPSCSRRRSPGRRPTSGVRLGSRAVAHGRPGRGGGKDRTIRRGSIGPEVELGVVDGAVPLLALVHAHGDIDLCSFGRLRERLGGGPGHHHRVLVQSRVQRFGDLVPHSRAPHP